MGKKYNHILVPNSPESIPYTNPGGGGSFNLKPQNRIEHGNYLKKTFSDAWKNAENEYATHKIKRNGVYLEFKSEDDFEIVLKSLESLRSKKQEQNIRLLNVKRDNGEQIATVYIPIQKANYFLDKIEKYLTENTQNGSPKNAPLLNNIKAINSALTIEAFWQDPKELIPSHEKEWCEIWLNRDDEEVKNRFEKQLQEKYIFYAEGFIDFPNRTVKLVSINHEELSDLIRNSDDIAEIRKAKELPSFFLSIPKNEQAGWVENLLSRLVINNQNKVSVCVHDTGINFGHPLISPLLLENDCLACKPGWGLNDHNGHGTQMAGVIGYGDLLSCLLRADQIEINHLLESVKILPNVGENDPQLWGYISSQAVSLSEINAPDRNRIHCMAVVVPDSLDRGRPSSWSGSLDQITSGAKGEGQPKRLFIVSAGNSPMNEKFRDYPNYEFSESVRDPAQAWNVISVGAFTELVDIQDADFNNYRPIAQKGYLSPYTTTSCLWNHDWPIKPEIVLEGGNAVTNEDGTDFSDCSDLSLLSTFYKPVERYFDSFSMTSAATAQASNLAAKIQDKYPDYWPETIRGLIIHSAEWTPALKQQLLRRDTKRDRYQMLRTCGYGVPNYDRAIYSASNCLTLIVQSEITPYSKVKDIIRPSTMHLYELPWPKQVLQDLPIDTQIKMRVTLSYFIEPGPGEYRAKDRYSYASHSLRFCLITPNEEIDNFKKRVNKALREEDEDFQNGSQESKMWFFGEQSRNKGSIHSDIWMGTAQELAKSNVIAVIPKGGWWKVRTKMDRWDRKTRYSLIVSLFTQEETVDIYTPVANQIKVPIQIQV